MNGDLAAFLYIVLIGGLWMLIVFMFTGAPELMERRRERRLAHYLTGLDETFAKRYALAALTADDRAWLTERGWEQQ